MSESLARSNGCSLRFRQLLVELRYHLKSVSDINHVGFAAGPAAVWVQGDSAALANESPTNNMRLFAVAAGGEPFGVARRGASLPDLVQMRQKWQHGVPFAALIH